MLAHLFLPLQTCITADAGLLGEHGHDLVLYPTDTIDEEGRHAIFRTIITLRDTIKRIVEGLGERQLAIDLITWCDNCIEMRRLHTVLVDSELSNTFF